MVAAAIEDMDQESQAVYAYKPIVGYWTKRYCHHRAYLDVEDVAQEAWIAAWQAHRAYDEACGYRRNVWVSFGVRRALDRLMSKHIRTLDSHEVSGQLLDSGERSAGDLNALFGVTDLGPWGQAWFRPVDLRDSIDGLEAAQRTMVWLHYFCDWEIREVSNRLAVCQATGSKIHQEALRALRRQLGVPELEGHPREHRTDEACNAGHPWTPESTYWIPSTGYRQCRICNAEAARRRRHRGPALRLRVRSPHKVA